MADTMNKTTSTGTAPLFQPVLNRYIIKRTEENLVYNQFAQKVKVPKGKTKTIAFDKNNPLKVSTAALAEGVTPDGQSLDVTRVTAEPSQYGQYVETTDEFEFFKHDPSPSVLRITELLGENAGVTFDTLTRNVLLTSTNVQFAGGRSSIKGIRSTDYFTVDEVRKAVRTLQNNKAPKIDGSYVCIIDADMAYDLQSDEHWKEVKVRDPKDLYTGEIGELYGVRFVQTTLPALKIQSTEAAENTVHVAFFIGAESYGSTDPKENVEMILKALGSAGSSDPLNQRSTAGWKGHHVAKILVNEWLVAVCCASSADSWLPHGDMEIAAVAGDGQLTLSWAALLDAESYRFSITDSNGEYQIINDITDTSYTLTGLTNGETYYIYYEGVNSAGVTADSKEITATPSA